MLYNSCLVLLLVATAQCVQFQVRNNAGKTIWVGILGNDKFPTMENGGFALQQGELRTVNSAEIWEGRFWPRTGCNSQTDHCETGDCGKGLHCAGNGGAPPATLVEIRLKGFGGLAYYDISLVDGFNIKASIQPIGGVGDGSKYSCTVASCSTPINDKCPEKLISRNGNNVIGCKSACAAFDTDQYCCRGDFNTSATCLTASWEVNSAKFFKDSCPDAYSYAYDDHKSTFTCKAATYLITFG